MQDICTEALRTGSKVKGRGLCGTGQRGRTICGGTGLGGLGRASARPGVQGTRGGRPRTEKVRAGCLQVVWKPLSDRCLTLHEAIVLQHASACGGGLMESKLVRCRVDFLQGEKPTQPRCAS